MLDGGLELIVVVILAKVHLVDQAQVAQQAHGAVHRGPAQVRVVLPRQAIEFFGVEVFSLRPDDIQKHTTLPRDAMLRGVQSGFEVGAFRSHGPQAVIGITFHFRL